MTPELSAAIARIRADVALATFGDTPAGQHYKDLSTLLSALEEAQAVRATVSIREMKLSGGRSDYFVILRVADRELEIRSHRILGRSEYEAEELRWVLDGSPKPDMIEWLDRTAEPVLTPTGAQP